MEYNITEINAADTLAIRHQVMWPNKPLDYVRLNDDAQGQHFGLYTNGQLISVISLFIANHEAQFRKFATLNEYQGKGYGSLLLQHILDVAQKQNVQKIWCNARVDKAGYYTKFGLKASNKTFEKGGIAYVIMEKAAE